ncbi:MAG: DUF1592 domain-containing protein [Bryobacteraceae bacterium]
MRVLLALLFASACFAQETAPRVQNRLFQEKVYPVLEKAECRMCHNNNGVSSATRLVFPPEDAGPGIINDFGLRLASLVDRAQPDQSLLLRKPTQRVAHAGGERIRRGSEEEAVLQQWVDYLAKAPEPEVRAARERFVERQGEVRHTALRRLTHSQYNNTVRDLLGDLTRPADHFPQEDFLNGFTNQIEGQSVSPLLAEAYTVAAEKLAANAFRQGDSNGLIPCKATSVHDAGCRDRFLREFGLRAFRRPLIDAEVRSYGALFTRAAVDHVDFRAGAKVVVEAMLQSPSFLFRLEAGPGEQFRQYEIASRLSYFLWDTMPNGELLRAAAASEFKDRESISRIARRMMDTPQARRSLDVFLAQWMRFDRVMASARNVRQYQDFGPSLLAAMTEETRHLFNHLVWNDRNFMELFSSDYTFITARLAQLYGLEPPPQDFAMLKYPAGNHRAGILGHASFLTLTGNPNETSPTSRGLFVREHFLCQHVPPPPPGVDTNLPTVTEERPMTTRERLAVHTTNASCAACHSLIDPIGLGLEGFDNIGRFREKVVIRIRQGRDAVTNQPRPPQTIELPLDTNGSIQGIPNSQFSTPAELGRILSNDSTCQRCVVKQLFRYAMGRHETPADQAQVDELFKSFRESGFRFRELVLSLVISPTFLGEGPQRASSSPSARPVLAEGNKSR